MPLTNWVISCIDRYSVFWYAGRIKNMDATDKNIQAYEKIKNNLEAGHMSEWALIHGEKLILIEDSFEKTAEQAVKKFGAGPYLIRQIGAPPVTLPASVVYNII